MCNTALNLYNTFLINTPPLSIHLAARPAVTIAFFCCCPKQSYFSKHFFLYQASCSLAPLMMIFKHCPRKKKKKERSCKPLPPLPLYTPATAPSQEQQFWAAQDHMLRFVLRLFKHKGMLQSSHPAYNHSKLGISFMFL